MPAILQRACGSAPWVSFESEEIEWYDGTSSRDVVEHSTNLSPSQRIPNDIVDADPRSLERLVVGIRFQAPIRCIWISTKEDTTTRVMSGRGLLDPQDALEYRTNAALFDGLTEGACNEGFTRLNAAAGQRPRLPVLPLVHEEEATSIIANNDKCEEPRRDRVA